METSLNEQIQFSTQVKNKMKPKVWVQVDLGTVLQFYGSSAFSQRYPPIA
jgi:hypothetical protein